MRENMKGLEKVTEIYAFVLDGQYEEGMLSTEWAPGLLLPFACSDKKRFESLRPFAEEAAKKSGKKIKLVKFTQREELETIDYSQ
jgi:hypothetical protein